MSQLHILNGDFALGHWRKFNFSADFLVWKETYIEGPLPDTDNLDIFRRARAGFLASFMELSGIGEERLYNHLLKMDEAVLNLPSTSILILWFDACIFDQTILMRILYLLKEKKRELPGIFLYCCDTNCLTLDDFRRGITEKVRLTAADLELASQAWLAFLRKDASAMKTLAEQGDFTNLPEMSKALLRCAEELPGVDGLNRSQRQILQIISSGSHTFKEIFAGLRSFEEHPFLGDTACLRLLDDLHRKGLIEIKQANSADTLYALRKFQLRKLRPGTKNSGKA